MYCVLCNNRITTGDIVCLLSFPIQIQGAGSYNLNDIIQKEHVVHYSCMLPYLPTTLLENCSPENVKLRKLIELFKEALHQMGAKVTDSDAHTFVIENFSADVDLKTLIENWFKKDGGP